MSEAAKLEVADQIWADEPNVMIRFELQSNGGVRIKILDVTTNHEKELAVATLGSWRWDRANKAMRP